MFNLGMGEITVILLLALIFLGPSKLPELASGLGKLIREIRKTTSDVKNEIQLDEAIRKPFDELRDAMTLHPDELKRRDSIAKELEEARQRLESEINAISETVNGAVDEVLHPPGEHAADHDHAYATEIPPPVLEGTATAESVANVPSAPVGTVARGDAARHENPPYLPPPAPTAIPGAKSGSIPSPLPGVKSGSISAPTPGSKSGSIFTNSPNESLRTTLKGTGDVPRRPTPPPPGIPSPTQPRVNPPGGGADAANATQFLSEADLLPSDPSATAPPPTPRATGQQKVPPPTPAKPPGEKKS